jgi:hypothetical protein
MCNIQQSSSTGRKAVYPYRLSAVSKGNKSEGRDTRMGLQLSEEQGQYIAALLNISVSRNGNHGKIAEMSNHELLEALIRMTLKCYELEERVKHLEERDRDLDQKLMWMSGVR